MPDATPGGERTAALQFLCVLAACVAGFQFGVGIGVAVLAGLVLLWPPAVPWRPVAVRHVLCTYFPFAVAWVGIVVVYLRAMDALGWTVAPQPELERLATEGLAMPDVGPFLLGVVVVAPVLEECFFRGYLFTALDRRCPRWVTQSVTAVAFGAAHGGDYAVPIGVLALFFGWQRARHGSLLPSILAHSMHNGLVAAVTLLWPGSLDLLYPR